MKSNDWESSATLAMWQGDVTAALAQVIHKEVGVMNRALYWYNLMHDITQTLSAEWVALSPFAGREIWEAMCVAYAYQLQQAGDVHKAVRYHSVPTGGWVGGTRRCLIPAHIPQALFFLTCHRVKDAVKVYSGVEMFGEAILLAKARLGAEVQPLLAFTQYSLFTTSIPNQDPLIRELYLEWVEWCERRAMYEQVAKWYSPCPSVDLFSSLIQHPPPPTHTHKLPGSRGCG